MKKLFNFGEVYRLIEENDGDGFFETPVEKTCDLVFETKKFKFSINLNEDEMKKLVGACVKAFGLKAVISAASEADDSDE